MLFPPRRPWSLFTGEAGATEIQFLSSGRQEYEAKHDSHHILWTENARVNPGQKHQFLSQFKVRSVKRVFRPGDEPISWEEVEALPPLTRASCEERGKEIHPRIQRIAEEIMERRAPYEAVMDFCMWIGERIKYDAAFPYETDNISAIITQEKGHCGHQAAVFCQFCAAAGIPVRTVMGLNLYEEDGVGELHETRADFTNIHTWAEIYLPRVGWVEVDPVGGNNPFVIQPHLIQNNRWFQNYSVWVRNAGEMRQPRWILGEDGKYESEYAIEHLITFRAQEG